MIIILNEIMRRFLTSLKSKSRKLIFIYGTSLIISLFSFLFFTIRGYPLVVTATEILTIEAPPLYMIPIFIPYGILLGEIIWLWNEQKERILYILLLIECMVIGLFSFIRYIVSIPLSGHMIILAFYLLHQVVNNKFQYPFRFIVGITVFIITLIYKIFIWNDLITFVLGFVLGVIAWLPGFFYRYKNIEKRNYEILNPDIRN
ncbi:MAG: hypothetical protein ACFE9Z_00640 [Promethearchaeota archaeon]